MIAIEPVAAFSDNYIWLMYDSDSRRAAVVDPGDAAPVEAALKARDLALDCILITHHHFDHTGGINDLLAERDIPVIGPASDNIPQITRHLRDGDQVSVLGLTFSAIAVPGHTLDHIALYTPDAGEQPVLFCGDTLFAGGCGRLFEGEPKMMYESLQRLSALPANTLVYCAHEYTLANLAFANAVEPDNRELAQRNDAARALRESDRPTVPSTLALELATNPFLRSDQAGVKTAAEAHCGTECPRDWEVFAAVRRWKDVF